jgi:YhcH/YjgK/YiaL family protein
MIIDAIQHAEKYFHLSKPLCLGLEYLMKSDFSLVKEGKYEIEADKVFAHVMNLETKPAIDGKWEAHKKYIDIHMVISGAERIGFAPVLSLSAGEYFEDKDFYYLEGKGQEVITIAPGQFVIFMPQDAHMPSLAVDHPSHIKKVVVKVIAK